MLLGKKTLEENGIRVYITLLLQRQHKESPDFRITVASCSHLEVLRKASNPLHTFM